MLRFSPWAIPHALASFLALWVESDAVSDSQANGITLSMGQIHPTSMINCFCVACDCSRGAL
ncbi:hypothetical Protein YC6258_00145 [Gynuella sunshinyii YC6258]|uniref:Uncharacterized protein n=1 Tax=Gynuella sunshinyii YC6258 TaxID=1445510 RepID=A0A0C5VD98_9GAMM|nr:hypothetical Protein YC6258_00145 [Gynuella sunshinyii YC6258]